MKYMNDLPVYEEDDICSLDEYSELMAEKVHQKIEKAKYDDTEIKEEETQQNKDIENLQTNDTKQNELISKLQEENKKLKSALINAETEEAKSIHVEDASSIGQLEVLGNVEQKTRSGKNKLKLENKTITSSGVTWNITEKQVDISGTTQVTYITYTTQFEIQPNTYKFIINDGTSGLNYRIWLKNSEHAMLANISNGSSAKLNSVATEYVLVVEGLTKGEAYNITFKPMLLLSTEEDESFEQYGVSPSPDYPSPIICLGSNKNLLNLANVQQTTKNGVTCTYNEDGSITLNGTCTSDNTIFKILNNNIDAIKNQTTISAFYVFGNITDENNEGAMFRINDVNYNGGFIDLTKLSEEKRMIKTYNSTSGIVTCDIRIDKNVILDNFTIKGKVANTLEEATSYSPYGQGSVGIKINNQDETQIKSYILPIQQEMLKGDYFFKEPDGWKEVHNWTKVDSYNGETITTEYISTTGELTKGATIYYKSATPTKLPCTSEQIAVLEELNNLDLFKPVTNIVTAEDIALLKLKYALDVKTYVNNLLASKIEESEVQE